MSSASFALESLTISSVGKDMGEWRWAYLREQFGNFKKKLCVLIFIVSYFVSKVANTQRD